jgi:ferredoxin-NADP reductase
MKLTLIQKKEEASDVTTFVFEPEAPLAYKAGQLLHYTLPHENPDDRGVERFFTISAPPYERRVTITTRFSEKSSTFKTALRALPVGATIEADNLEGDFVVEEETGEHVFLVGGIGITPVHSILLDLDNRGASINATVLYANRDENFVFKRELDALVGKHPKLKIVYLVSPARIDEATIRENVQDLGKPVFYISGPEPMVIALGDTLTNMGVPKERQKRDEFPGYPAP